MGPRAVGLDAEELTAEDRAEWRQKALQAMADGQEWGHVVVLLLDETEFLSEQLGQLVNE